MKNYEKALILINGVEKYNLEVEKEYQSKKEAINNRIKDIQTLCNHDFVFGTKKQRFQDKCHCIICRKEFVLDENMEFKYFINFEDICKDNNINVVSIHDHYYLYNNLFNLLNSKFKSLVNDGLVNNNELYELLNLAAKENVDIYYSSLLEEKPNVRLMK